MKVAFFGLEPKERAHLESVSALKEASLELVFYDGVLDKDRIPADADFDIISVFVGSIVGAEVLKEMPNLQLITTRSTGYDHIDLIACAKHGVAIAYVPSYGEHTVAEFTFALILALSRKIYDAYHRVREEGSFNLDGLRGFDLQGKTLGVVGTGNIGRNVVAIAKGFEMEIIAYDVKEDEEFSKKYEFKYCSLEEVFEKSDIITLHVPYLKSTHHLISKDNIYTIKKGAYLINTSRGAVIETEALVEALKSGHIAGAGLDVLEEEGVVKDELSFLVGGHPEEHNLKIALANHAFIDLKNVIVTPHNAFNTTEALRRILDVTIENIVSFSNEKPINIVKQV